MTNSTAREAKPKRGSGSSASSKEGRMKESRDSNSSGKQGSGEKQKCSRESEPSDAKRKVKGDAKRKMKAGGQRAKEKRQESSAESRCDKNDCASPEKKEEVSKSKMGEGAYDTSGVEYWWYRAALGMPDVFEKSTKYDGVLHCKWCQKEITNPASFAAHLGSKYHLKAHDNYEKDGFCQATLEKLEQLKVDLDVFVDSGTFPEGVCAASACLSDIQTEDIQKSDGGQDTVDAVIDEIIGESNVAQHGRHEEHPAGVRHQGVVTISAESYDTLQNAFEKLQSEAHSMRHEFESMRKSYQDVMVAMRNERVNLQNM